MVVSDALGALLGRADTGERVGSSDGDRVGAPLGRADTLGPPLGRADNGESVGTSEGGVVDLMLGASLGRVADTLGPPLGRADSGESVGTSDGGTGVVDLLLGASLGREGDPLGATVVGLDMLGKPVAPSNLVGIGEGKLVVVVRIVGALVCGNRTGRSVGHMSGGKSGPVGVNVGVSGIISGVGLDMLGNPVAPSNLVGIAEGKLVVILPMVGTFVCGSRTGRSVGCMSGGKSGPVGVNVGVVSAVVGALFGVPSTGGDVVSTTGPSTEAGLNVGVGVSLLLESVVVTVGVVPPSTQNSCNARDPNSFPSNFWTPSRNPW